MIFDFKFVPRPVLGSCGDTFPCWGWIRWAADNRVVVQRHRSALKTDNILLLVIRNPIHLKPAFPKWEEWFSREGFNQQFKQDRSYSVHHWLWVLVFIRWSHSSFTGVSEKRWMISSWFNPPYQDYSFRFHHSSALSFTHIGSEFLFRSCLHMSGIKGAFSAV